VQQGTAYLTLLVLPVLVQQGTAYLTLLVLPVLVQQGTVCLMKFLLNEAPGSAIHKKSLHQAVENGSRQEVH
jgi:hypothetical protein